MRKLAIGLGFVWVLLMFMGCGKRPPEVSAATEARNQSIKAYVANDNAADAFLIEKYKESELRRVDMAYKLKMAEVKAALSKDLQTLADANGGVLNFNPKQAASVISQLEKKKEAILFKRDAMRQQVELVINALYTARERNKINLAIATKLNAAIEEYENAGVDMSMAQKSIDSIFLLLQKHNVLDIDGPTRPTIILPTPKK